MAIQGKKKRKSGLFLANNSGGVLLGKGVWRLFLVEKWQLPRAEDDGNKKMLLEVGDGGRRWVMIGGELSVGDEEKNGMGGKKKKKKNNCLQVEISIL